MRSSSLSASQWDCERRNERIEKKRADGDDGDHVDARPDHELRRAPIGEAEAGEAAGCAAGPAASSAGEVGTAGLASWRESMDMPALEKREGAARSGLGEGGVRHIVGVEEARNSSSRRSHT